MRALTTIAALTVLAATFLPISAHADGSTGADDGWTATSSSFDPTDFRAAPYLGNGRIGTVIPPAGGGYQIYADGVRGTFPLWDRRYTGTFLAGFYATQSGSYNNTQAIAALPSWSGLYVAVGNHLYDAGVDPNTVSHYTQTLNYRDALVTTRLTWTPDIDHALDMVYRTFISRRDPNVAVQQLTITPRYDGTIAVIDRIDGAAARRVSPVLAFSDSYAQQAVVGVRAEGTDKTAFIVSSMQTPESSTAKSTGTGSDEVAKTEGTATNRFEQSVGAGQAYEFTKYVGIASSDDGPDPRQVATAASVAARDQGFQAEAADSAFDWHELWQPAVEIPGRDDYQQWIRSAFYSILSSVRAGQPWSVQPAGLSSDDYAGATFWDAETWVFPTLLAFYPDLARTIVDLRYAALPQALANARGYGLPGALYPWDDGPDQKCATPLVCGLGEEHLHNEIVLAQWQYYLATGDRVWLRTRGFPVIAGIAEYLAGRIGPRAFDGKYHYAPVGGADEYVPASIDNALTNAGVVSTMNIASAASRLLGQPTPAQWSDIADNMAMPDNIAPGVPAEYSGYSGQQIKQADTVLLSYPFSYTAPDYSPIDSIHYYFGEMSPGGESRTDPNGPNMSNSAAAILSAQYEPCRTQYYLDRSAIPYASAPYYFQSENIGVKSSEDALVRSVKQVLTQPAWVFVTGEGGFLQGLLYGPTGLRWATDAPRIDPMLPDGFQDGIEVHGVVVNGSRLSIDIRGAATTIALMSGPAVTIDTPVGRKLVSGDTLVTIPTRKACS